MSIHSSLRAIGKGKKHRSVLKRYERLKVLKDKSLWSDESSVLGLPKVKQQKLKVKKEKAAPAEAASDVPPTVATVLPAKIKPRYNLLQTRAWFG